MAQEPNENDPLLRLRRAERTPRPEFPPSDTVHIEPTQKPLGTAMWSAPSYWITQGFDLKTLLGMLYDFDVTRIDFADPAIAKMRYDVAFVPPAEVGDVAMKKSIRTALERELGLVVTMNARPRDVYIVTLPDGPGAGLRASTSMGGFTTTSSMLAVRKGAVPPTAEEIDQLLSGKVTSDGVGVDSISLSSGTIKDFCATLERNLDRPVIDESGLRGSYEIELKRDGMNREQFFARIREQFGLQVLPGQREVVTLTVRSN